MKTMSAFKNGGGCNSQIIKPSVSGSSFTIEINKMPPICFSQVRPC